MDVTDIVARLEERAVLNDNPTYREAAAALRQQVREIERLKGKHCAYCGAFAPGHTLACTAIHQSDP